MKTNKLVYDIMRKDEKVAELIYEDTKFGYKLSIRTDCIEKTPVDLKVWFISENTNVLNHDIVLDWIKGRVTPPTQDGIDEKLKGMGLKEYDEWKIFNISKGIVLSDFTWVKFNKKDTFKSVHIRADEC